MGTAQLIFFVLQLAIVTKISCSNEVMNEKDVYGNDGEERDSRFSLFQIIKFANEPCIGSNRNGTCFTKAECENEGGTESGSCADGFGVCCIRILGDGESTSLNQSYIYQASSTSLGVGSREYTICPCSSDVCRIKFDFTSFNLAAPFTGTTAANSAGQDALRFGDCQIDTFSITSPAYVGSPVICGTNEQQHMILDSDGTSCSKVNIGLGNGAGTTAREWDIKVTQYTCSEEDGGPPGCLQWHTTATGSFRSFNFPLLARGGTVGNTVTHLSNQEYEICIRTPSGVNHICYIPCTAPADSSIATAQASFGISIAVINQKGNADNTYCSTDYLRITGGNTAAIAQAGIIVAAAQSTLFCGRALAPPAAAGTAYSNTVSLCTFAQPFRVGVHFDADEYPTASADAIITDAGNAATAAISETITATGGIVGFSLCYTTGTPTAG